LYIYRDNEAYSVLLYIWNITPGGKNRPLDEYRVQVTGVAGFEEHAEYKTLILGYWSDQDLFAGWDVKFHLGQLGASPSLQIREQYLTAAVERGFAVARKDQGELAVAFTPSFVMTYIRNLEGLHAAGAIAEDVDVLEHIAEDGAIDEVDLAPLPAARQKVVRTFAQNFREASFRRRVLTAYGSACAMCGMQLKLVEAAHIIPVFDPQSTDETTNGICLCVLHHKAMDRSLLGIAQDYRILVNDSEFNRLGNENLGGGTQLVRDGIGIMIRLPAEETLRPDPAYLGTALEVRRFPI
jgi:putative restriction endonuclease